MTEGKNLFINFFKWLFKWILIVSIILIFFIWLYYESYEAEKPDYAFACKLDMQDKYGARERYFLVTKNGWFGQKPYKLKKPAFMSNAIEKSTTSKDTLLINYYESLDNSYLYFGTYDANYFRINRIDGTLFERKKKAGNWRIIHDCEKITPKEFYKRTEVILKKLQKQFKF